MRPNAPMKNIKRPIVNIEEHEKQQGRKAAKKAAKLEKKKRQASKVHNLREALAS